MKKEKEKNKNNRKGSGQRKHSWQYRAVSIMCVILLVCSTVIFDPGLSRANSFENEIALETEENENTEVQESSEDGSEVNISQEDEFSDTPQETNTTEEQLDANAEDGADFSAGDNEEASQSETVTYTKLINNDTVEVKAEAEAGTLPEGAELNVTSVEKETEQYTSVEKVLTSLAQNKENWLAGFFAYNISFTDTEGNAVEPNGKVHYSFQYTEPVAPELTDPANTTVTAVKIRKNSETSEMEFVELNTEDHKLTLEMNESRQLQKAGFQSADTATVAFVWNSTETALAEDNNGEVQNPEPQPEENPDQAPEQTPIGTIQITADEVNLRTAPSTAAEVITAVNSGTQLPLLETVAAEDGSTWYKVTYEEQIAYVRSDMAAVVGEGQEEAAEEVPTEEAPAEITRYDYQSDEVNVKVTLTNPEDLPDNAELSVTPVELSQEAEEQITEEAIKESKAIESIRSYDIKFLVNGEEVQPGATVKVEVSFPNEISTEDAAVYHVDQNENVENMSGSVNEEGNVEFETTHFSTYVIVNNKSGEDNNQINVTVEHYDETTGQKIYADDPRTLKVGQRVDCKKATNWDIDYVTVNTNGTDTTVDEGDILLAQDAVVKVYYKPSTGAKVGNPNFYDYTIKVKTKSNWWGAAEYASFNSNATGAKLTAGTSEQNLAEFKYDNAINNWTGSSNVVTGLLKGINSSGEVEFNYNDPGFFTSDSRKVTDASGNEVYLKKYYDNYTMELARTGDTYKLSKIKDSNNNVVATVDLTQSDKATAGKRFFPLDNVGYQNNSNVEDIKENNSATAVTGEAQHNYYFGMRYDIDFTLGDYIGDLTYNFTGDDDMWVVLRDETENQETENQQIILDLGGIHNAATGSVNLWEKLYNGKYADPAKRSSISDEEKNAKHTLTVLYLERGGGESNCYMEFTIPNATISQVTTDPRGTLELQKINSNGTGLNGAEFTLYDDIDCNMKREDAESKTVDGIDGKVIFNSKLKKGRYYLKETQAPDGYVASSDQWIVDVKEDGTVTLKDSLGNIVENNQIVNQTKQEIIEGRLVYNKTAVVNDWEKRTYDINITATSKYKSSTTTEKNSVADIMMVLDTSGSMLYGNDNKDSDGFVKVGKYKDVKATLETSKVYYYGNATENVMYSQWSYNNAKSPMICLNGAWMYFNGSSWTAAPSNDTTTIYTVDSSLTGLKEAATAFIASTANVSSGSRIGLATFNSDSNLVSGLTTAGTSKAALIQAVNSIRALAGTSPQKGLDIAYNQLTDGKRKDVPQYVILFTDGAPSSGTDKSESEKKAEELKEKGITVFTVGLNLNEDTKAWLKDKIASENCAFEADSVDGLKVIFKKIQETISDSIDITGATITDVIDSRFEILKADGTRLEDKDFDANNDYQLGEDGVVTKLNDGTYQVRWENQTIPADGQWSKTITVRAKDEYIGGNNVTTNAAGSQIETGYETVELPYPTVNVKSDLVVNNNEVTIFYGDKVPTDAEIIKKLFDESKPQGYVKQLDGTYKLVTYTMGADGQPFNPANTDKDFTLTWYKDAACTELADLANETPEPKSKEYYLKVTYNKLGDAKTGDTWTTNTDGNISGDVTVDEETQIKTGTGKVTAHNSQKDTNRQYGVYKINIIAGQIQITKVVDEAPTEDKTFTFNVTDKDGNPLTVTVKVKKGKTTGEETATLDNLKRGLYTVTEADTDGYTVDTTNTDGTNCEVSTNESTHAITFNIGYEFEKPNKDVIKKEKDAAGNVINYTYKDGGTLGKVEYKNKEIKANLDLKKTATDGKKLLSGAKFKLEMKSGNGWSSVNSSYDSFEVENDDDQIELNNLRNGDYKLTEIQAPTGYTLLATDVYFKVDKGTIKLTDKDGKELENQQTMWTLEGNVLTIKNAKVYSLPSSGGSGTYGFTISGVAILTAALLLFIKNKRKEDEACRSTH